LKHNKLFLLSYHKIFGEQFLSWKGDLKESQHKPKLSIEEITDFIFAHPEWAATVIKNALKSTMYRIFCSCCEKLGMIKNERELGCFCNEFLNQKNS
jgi:hypothetical protein